MKNTPMIQKEDVGLLPLDGENLVGKVLVLEPTKLGDVWQQPIHQFYLAIGGFGCDPDCIGKTVYAKAVTDNERVRLSREDFIGIASKELTKKYFHKCKN